MKFLHLADLHFGKSIHGVSLLENYDQPFWVEQFLALVQKVQPDAVIIAGDVYDRSTPSADAVQLLDYMLTELSKLGLPVLMVAGNHDSGQRLAFASQLLSKQNLHIAGVLPRTKQLEHVTLKDKNGPVTFWLLPYVFPALVSQVMEDDTIRDYDTAVRRLLDIQEIDVTQRNVLVAHQNVIAGGVEVIRGGSESMVGGVGQIDFTAFKDFDYVALGHIHSSYHVGKETIRYAGSPLCYHFEETKQKAKGPILVNLGSKGTQVTTETCLIPALHPMREIKGNYEEIRNTELARETTNEYIRIVLTDRRVTPDISVFFHGLYQAKGSILMELVSEFNQFSGAVTSPAAGTMEEKAIEQLFADFYTERNGGEMPTDRDLELFSFVGEQTRHAELHSEPDEQEVEKLLAFLLKQEEQK